MQRLDLNLSTQPFRNNTPIWAAYAVALTLLLGFAAWNGTTYFRHLVLLEEKKSHIQDLAAQQADLEARQRVADRERKRRELSLEALTIQSLKANEVIDWKAFSWTELFNRLESALPWNVYMVAVRPVFRAERGSDARAAIPGVRSRPVAVEGYAKSLTALLDFERKLFASEYFDDPEPLRHTRDERDELIFTMRFMYYPDGRPRETVIEDEGEAAAEVAKTPDAQQPVEAEEPKGPAATATAAGKADLEPVDPGGSIGLKNPPPIKRASERAGSKPPSSAPSKKPPPQEVRP